jgi:hypothetical protein
MLTHTVMLNALYDAGNKIAPAVGYIFILLMSVELLYVFVKYVITSNK